MSNERVMWNQVRQAFKGKLLVQRIESHGTSAGIPDLVFANGREIGFIELKYLPRWPKRSSTPVNIRTFTPYQRNFLTKWSKWSDGMCFLMLKVDRKEFLVFDQFENIGKMTRDEMVKEAWLYHENGLKVDDLTDKLWNRQMR